MNQLKQVGELKILQWTESRRRIYTCNGLSPTLNGIGRGGNTEPKVLIRRDYEFKTNIRTADSELAQNC